MGWDTQINGDGDTLADAMYARASGTEDQLEIIAEQLTRIADVLELLTTPQMVIVPPPETGIARLRRALGMGTQ